MYLSMYLSVYLKITILLKFKSYKKLKSSAISFFLISISSNEIKNEKFPSCIFTEEQIILTKGNCNFSGLYDVRKKPRTLYYRFLVVREESANAH